MTNEEAIAILDTIPTIGEQVDALEMAIEALQPWRVITKRPMTFVEKKDYAESIGWEIAEEDAFIYGNLPEDGKEVLACTWYGHIYIDTLYSDDQGCYFDKHGEIEGVIAWMPLPEPYKEAKDEH